MKMRAMLENERHYAYSHESDEDERCGCIGHLRGDFDSNGLQFYSSWFDHHTPYKTDQFKEAFDSVVNRLRIIGVLKNRNSMADYCKQYPGSSFQGNYCTEYGFRIEMKPYTCILRCNPTRGDYNFYMYAYITELLDAVLNG